MRSRSRRTHGAWTRLGLAAALLALPLAGLTAVGASAGQPVTLGVENDGTGKAAAAADSARKAAAKKAATTASKAAAKPAAPTTPRTTTTSKTSVSPAKPTAPATSAKTAQPGVKAPAPSKAASTVAKAPPTTRANPTVAKAPATTRTPTAARIAPAPSRPGAKTASVAKIPARTPTASAGVAPSRVAKLPTTAKVAATGPSVAKVSPAPARPGGDALAKRGATTVEAPPAPSNVTPVKPGAATRVGVAAGGATVAGKTSNPAGAPSLAAKVAPREDHVTYQYNALGRRDPFQSLMEGEYVGADVGGQAPPDLGGLKVMGIVWGGNDQFAMVEDVRGNSYVLRRGDRVMNGFVEGLKRDAMIVNITVDGQSQSVSIPVTRKGDRSNANR